LAFIRVKGEIRGGPGGKKGGGITKRVVVGRGEPMVTYEQIELGRRESRHCRLHVGETTRNIEEQKSNIEKISEKKAARGGN